MILKRRDIPLIISVDKIWDFALHNAFTDLVRYQERWFVTFREADTRENGNNGMIRILESFDGISWRSVAIISMSGVDLRDPKLSVTSNGRLMLLAGGNQYYDSQGPSKNQSYVAFSDDGGTWNDLKPVLNLHEWLWRVTWFEGKAYGVSYRYKNPLDRAGEWVTTLYQSDNGSNYSPIVQWDINGQPNETTLQFTNDGMMLALVRRSKEQDSNAWFGASLPPYRDWDWVLSKYSLGGPNFVVLPSGKMWTAGRMIANTPYGAIEKTMLGRLDFDGIHPVTVLPSGGDTGYPGMVYHEGILYMSYYSSHEERSAIYLVKAQLPFDSSD